MARDEHFSHRGPGVLGVFRSNPEIVGVFPELSATAIPHAQEIRLRRGDSLNIGVQIQNDVDPPDPMAIDGSVVRWAAKIGFGQTERDGVTVGNEGALIIKRSSDTEEIEFASGIGRVEIHIRRADTTDLPLSPAVWDLEITVPTEAIEVPTGGSVQFISSSALILATGLDWSALGLHPGDLLTAQGRTVMVIRVVSPAHLEVDFSGWATEIVPSASIVLQAGQTKTVASGPFVVEGDVVL